MFRKRVIQRFTAASNGAWGEPTFFVVQNWATVNTIKFGLPSTYGSSVYLIEFRAKHLECPSSEPIGVYHYAGIRRFIWRDRFWNEVDIDYRDMMKKAATLLTQSHDQSEAMNLRVLLGLLQQYRTISAPLPNANEEQVFCRAMYEIN